MPFADFTYVMSDPEVVDHFIVHRRSASVDGNGRSRPYTVAKYRAAGIVTAASPDQLMRLPDQEHQQKAISVTTIFRLQGPRPGQQPDYVVWPSRNGDTYVVMLIDDSTNFGKGFVNATCQRIDVTSATTQDSPQVAN